MPAAVGRDGHNAASRRDPLYASGRPLLLGHGKGRHGSSVHALGMVGVAWATSVFFLVAQFTIAWVFNQDGVSGSSHCMMGTSTLCGAAG